MTVFSPSSPSNTKFTLFRPSQTPNYTKFTLFRPSQTPNSSKFNFIIPFKISHSTPSHQFLAYSHESSSSSASSSSSLSSSSVFQENPQSTAKETEIDEKDEFAEDIRKAKKSLKELLLVRRPLMEFPEDDDNEKKNSWMIENGLSEFAKKMPIFEPERIQSNPPEKPLTVNLDLALYKAKILTKNFRYEEAETIIKKCIYYWPEDGRPYVALGKSLSRQSRLNEARAVYEKGCQATFGENSYIWQCWAVLENKMGNITRARELFDAATVADKKHIAAWHGWAVLELKQGNIKKARNLLGKAIKFCGGNEYVYQTLALLEVKAKRYEQARYFFKQATKYNPKSCASWLAWAQLEARQENEWAAMRLFEKAVKGSPKNRFAWHAWGVFEANLGNYELGKKLLKIGHAVNPRDPVLLQSLALLEYRYSSANIARVLFQRASELDPKHQPVWMAWGWMEWKEGNLATARELYQKALSIDLTSETAARCLQAWGVLEQRVGNLSAARKLFRSSLNINSQSFVTWMTWASLEEDQGNSVRAEEIRELYFQQRTEVVDDPSWIMGFLDIIDPAIDSIKRLFNIDSNSYYKNKDFMRNMSGADGGGGPEDFDFDNIAYSESSFNLDEFIVTKLHLDPKKLDVKLVPLKKVPSWRS